MKSSYCICWKVRHFCYNNNLKCGLLHRRILACLELVCIMALSVRNTCCPQWKPKTVLRIWWPHNRAPTAHGYTLLSNLTSNSSSPPCLGPFINMFVMLSPFHSMTLWKKHKCPMILMGETEAQQGQGIYPRKAPVISIGTKICSHVFLIIKPSLLVPCLAVFPESVFVAVPCRGSESFLWLLLVPTYAHTGVHPGLQRNQTCLLSTKCKSHIPLTSVQTWIIHSKHETDLLCTPLWQWAARLWFL